MEKANRNIVLIGMRGSGKTTIAKILSQKTGRELLELDELLVAKMGMKIPEIVEKYGWGHFRDIESQIVKEISKQKSMVISTGGGVVLRSENMAALKDNGVVIYLCCSVKVLAQRIGYDPNRPALTAQKTLEEELGELLTQRQNLYNKYADIVIDADNQDAVGKADQILERII